MFKKIIFKINKSIITQKTSSLQKRGDILISYTTLPFLEPKKISSHSNRWECQEITRIFNDRGFNVDIIDHTNKKFIPKKKYRYCLDISDNLERLNGYLNKDCIKIFHITGAHWLSDVIVGSGSIALICLSWLFCTPWFAKLIPFAEHQSLEREPNL